MVHFGRTIEQQREEEWEAGYVDYKELKRTLSEMIAAGNIQEFSEDTVYSPVSVATYHQVLQPKGPREQDFLAQIDSEIEKVNVFTQGLHAKLEQKLAKVQQRQQASLTHFPHSCHSPPHVSLAILPMHHGHMCSGVGQKGVAAIRVMSDHRGGGRHLGLVAKVRELRQPQLHGLLQDFEEA